MDVALVLVVAALALTFDFTNGFHDAANAIATSVSTRALTPRAALAMAAVMNFAGALMGTAVAETIAHEIIHIDDVGTRLTLVAVLAALVGAIVWNLITWWFGLPSSSTHALIGGLVGAGLAGGIAVYWSSIVEAAMEARGATPGAGGLRVLEHLWSEAVAEAILDVPDAAAALVADAGAAVEDDGSIVVARSVGATTRSRATRWSRAAQGSTHSLL